ncbi:unnamed protein product [Linum trigynum]|uniref:LOB domain-containing protein n=1 Tax=Linum trigynum TaxID=586398 RepID=A0AAV2CJ63_9ROSI
MSSNQNQNQNGARSRCAGCKFLRRRCAQDCILAPYFPPNNPHRFASVHKVFGASNVTKMLQAVPEEMRGKAADSMSYEASIRVQDPVYGCAGMIYQLQNQIMEVQSQIDIVKGKTAFYSAQQHQQQQQQQIEIGVGDGGGLGFGDFHGVDDQLLLWNGLAGVQHLEDKFN